MRLFTNDEAVRESGLTRGQIDQFISRWGFAIYGQTGTNKGRYFADVDMFNLIVAGQLSAFGVSMPKLRDLFAGGLGFYRLNTETGKPAEVFPGQIAAGSGPCAIVIYRWKDQWVSRIEKGPREGPAYGPAGTVAIVIDASGLVDRINAVAAARSLA